MLSLPHTRPVPFLRLPADTSAKKILTPCRFKGFQKSPVSFIVISCLFCERQVSRYKLYILIFHDVLSSAVSDSSALFCRSAGQRKQTVFLSVFPSCLHAEQMEKPAGQCCRLLHISFLPPQSPSPDTHVFSSASFRRPFSILPSMILAPGALSFSPSADRPRPLPPDVAKSTMVFPESHSFPEMY